MKEITPEAARAVLGCEINCGWYGGPINGCDYYGDEEIIQFTKQIIDRKSIRCPDGVIETSSAEAIGIVNQ